MVQSAFGSVLHREREGSRRDQAVWREPEEDAAKLDDIHSQTGLERERERGGGGGGRGRGREEGRERLVMCRQAKLVISPTSMLPIMADLKKSVSRYTLR